MRSVLRILIFAAALAGLYSRAITSGFLLDDVLFLTNENVTDPARWTHFFKLDSLRPVTYLSLHFNYRWGGSNPLSYHLVNLLLHLVNSILVFACLKEFWKLRKAPPRGREAHGQSALADLPAYAGAAFFAFHPLQTEAVNYVYQRSTLLAAGFGLCGMLCLARRPGSWTARIGAALFYLLAVLSKESALVWPLVYLAAGAASSLRDDWNRGLPGIRELLKRRAAWLRWFGVSLLLVIAVAGWALWEIQNSADHTLGFKARYDPATYLRGQCGVILDYLRMVVFPSGQNLDHDPAVPAPWGFAALWPPLVLALFLAASAAAAVRDFPAGWGMLICALFLLPTSSLVPSNDLMFEHRMYLPLLGLSLAVSAAAAWIQERAPLLASRRWLFPAALAAYLLPWTWARNALWADPAALWRDAAMHSPHKARPRVALGTLLLERDPRAASAVLQEALELEPRSREALNNLALARLRMGEGDRAEPLWKKAIELDPSFAPAHRNLAGYYYSQKRYREAAANYQAVLRLRPGDWQSSLGLGNAHWRLHETGEAEQGFRQALSANPGSVDALNNLAAVLEAQGRSAEAEKRIRQALALDSSTIEARINLAQLLLKQSRLAEARQELDRIITLDNKGKYQDRIRSLSRRLAEH